jgi:hypothetical protein
MPVAIGLDAIGEFGEVRITKNLCPTGQVESGLRSQIWKLDGDRHESMIRQKRKYASTVTERAKGDVITGCIGVVYRALGRCPRFRRESIGELVSVFNFHRVGTSLGGAGSGHADGVWADQPCEG